MRETDAASAGNVYEAVAAWLKGVVGADIPVGRDITEQALHDEIHDELGGRCRRWVLAVYDLAAGVLSYVRSLPGTGGWTVRDVACACDFQLIPCPGDGGYASDVTTIDDLVSWAVRHACKGSRLRLSGEWPTGTIERDELLVKAATELVKIVVAKAAWEESVARVWQGA